MIRDEENREQALKKVYKNPELTVYGAIVNLTQAIGARGQRDGGTRAGRKHT